MNGRGVLVANNRTTASVIGALLVLAACSSTDVPPTLIDGVEFGEVEYGSSAEVPLISDSLVGASQVAWQSGKRDWGGRGVGLEVYRTAIFASFDDATFSKLTEGIVLGECVRPIGVSAGLVELVPQTEPSCSSEFDRQWNQGDTGATFYFFDEDRSIYVIVSSG